MTAFRPTKFHVAATLIFAAVIAQSFIPRPDEQPKKFENLKVLPKNITFDELQEIMKGYSKSLGVRCNYCHVALEGGPGKLQFSSDAKPEKRTARKMIVMVNNINKKYLRKMGEHFEEVTCVTCHMGNVTPLANVDSLSGLPKFK